MDDAEPGFGPRLRWYRERAGLTHQALAERAGASASAIAALERGRRQRPYPYTVDRLAEALQLEPDERTAFIALARSPRAGRSEQSPRLPRATPRSNLPAPRTRLIGRERELGALVELVSNHAGRLVTLTGIGGGGKTRLAFAAAEALRATFPDGVWLVEFAPIADPALVPQAVAAVFDLPEVAGATALDRLADALCRRSLLLVLDNCEHLIAACAELAERLLAGCPSLRILATSREPLQLAGEYQRRVPPLALPDPDQPASPAELARCPAVQLFVERARAVNADFNFTAGNVDAVTGICARLDGIPLALELAAARVRVLGVAQILERLDDSLQLLTGNSRAAPTRQQTLRATLDWSYQLLTVPEQALFRRLATFAGGCDIAAAEAIGVGPDVQAADVLDLLTELLDKSLVLVEEETGTACYRLLEPVRQYAIERTAKGELEATRVRHAARYLALAERAAPHLRGPDQVAWLACLERESGNLRAALSWATALGELETEARLVVALAPFWEGHMHLREGRQALEAALARPVNGIAPALRRQVLIAAGRLAQWQGDLDGAIPLLAESLTAAEAAADRRGIAETLVWLGIVQMRRIATGEAADLLEESLARFRELADEPGIALVLLALGTTRGNQGDYQRACTLLEECRQRSQQQGDLRTVAMARTMLGTFLHYAGDHEQAAANVREGLAGHLQVGDWVFLVQGIRGATAIAAEPRPRQAARLLGAAEGLRAMLGASSPPRDRATDQRVTATIRAGLSGGRVRRRVGGGPRSDAGPGGGGGAEQHGAVCTSGRREPGSVTRSRA
ncbi:MAG TPA: helix-turn-helix domain-containing protein [Dehalococcoidia bacterium]|nr:helix-turn-helix domain-containing protein [Dehalococcoidia bacterium]